MNWIYGRLCHISDDLHINERSPGCCSLLCNTLNKNWIHKRWVYVSQHRPVVNFRTHAWNALPTCAYQLYNSAYHKLRRVSLCFLKRLQTTTLRCASWNYLILVKYSLEECGSLACTAKYQRWTSRRGKLKTGLRCGFVGFSLTWQKTTYEARRSVIRGLCIEFAPNPLRAANEPSRFTRQQSGFVMVPVIRYSSCLTVNLADSPSNYRSPHHSSCTCTPRTMTDTSGWWGDGGGNGDDLGEPDPDLWLYGRDSLGPECDGFFPERSWSAMRSTNNGLGREVSNIQIDRFEKNPNHFAKSTNPFHRCFGGTRRIQMQHSALRALHSQDGLWTRQGLLESPHPHA